MATSNKIRALNRLPFDFQDGLKIGGVDVSELNQLGTSAGASIVGYMPAGTGAVATTVQSKLREFDQLRIDLADPAKGAALVAISAVAVDNIGGLQSIKRDPSLRYLVAAFHAGWAATVRGPTGGGEFVWNPTSTASAVPGIIISVAGVPTGRFMRVYSGAIDVSWCGAKGDWNGTSGTDDTAAFNAAYTYARFSVGTNNRGAGKIYVPKGMFLVDGVVNFSSALGLEFFGDSPEATQIIRTVHTGTVFAITVSQQAKIHGIRFQLITAAPRESWTVKLFSVTGTGGTSQLQIDRIVARGFDRVLSHDDSNANLDCNLITNSWFQDCKTFQYTRNSQGIANSIRNCNFYYNIDVCFDLGGFGHTHFDTVSCFNGGVFLKLATSQSGTASQYTLTNCKFEYWNNSTANNVLGTSRIIEMEDEQSNVAYITLNNCAISGGTPNPDIYQFDMLGGTYTLQINGGQYGGCKIRTKGRNTKLINGWWIECNDLISSPSPIIERVASVSSSGHVPVTFNNCRGVSNVTLRGPGNSFTSTKPAGTGSGKHHNIINNPNGYLMVANAVGQTTSHSIPMYEQLTIVEKVMVFVQTSGSGSPTIEIKAFSDAAKTVQIGSTITVSSYVSPAAYEISIPANLVVTEGVFVDIKNTTGTSVFIFGEVHVDTLNV